MATHYDILVKDNGKQVKILRACRLPHAMEIAQAAVLRWRNHASVEILCQRSKPPSLVMRYWWDDGLQYMEY